MAKKKESPPDSATLSLSLRDFYRANDRGSAIAAAAWVDDCLAEYLRSVLRPEAILLDELLRSDGPIGSFGARIKLAYVLGLIEPTAYADLNIIRGIRNDFAHRRGALRFTAQSLRDRCKTLNAAAAFELGAGPIRSMRERFLITAYFVSEYMLQLARNHKLGDMLKGDSYGVWIRHWAKDAAMAEVLSN